MENARLRCLHTSCGVSKIEQVTAYSERVRFLIQNNERVNTVQKNFPSGIMFVIYILTLNALLKLWLRGGGGGVGGSNFVLVPTACFFEFLLR